MLEIYKKVVFENYANFKGRARRKEFWTVVLVNVIISVVLSVVLGIISSSIAMLANIFSLAVLIPSIAVGVRRMHDVGKSGWYILIPLYDIYLAAMEGERGPNQYGADPKSQLEDLKEIGKDLN
ncbi:DUF805 domain-containing protein [Flavobacterium quisquiliarum]|jgi:uncharacterized membrane protein YhaH (DUF805 family)|uniref:DUF805 domain-containing protein n=1 Tax=Flavobacterium quisquiliarum TaxID=1834436 RepID=A0ABV8WDW6_9FLAO|nr:DUF805 domain-containing protein [Flavobacterium quisquiliarum]MBW1657867.1 DUF805 domain-containing protein [Flavobacterium quisquiliarum]NWL00926.1 DUF805 domain-containing protein [Flavobacterium collinsii]